MNRVSVADASHDLPSVLRRVSGNGESFALEEAERVVAWLTPPEPMREFSVVDLERLLASLPRLGDDLEAFSQDIESAKSAIPLESSRWD